MSTDQAILEALWQHHAETIKAHYQPDPEPMKTESGKLMMDTLAIAVREAFLAGALAEHRNPLPKP